MKLSNKLFLPILAISLVAPSAFASKNPKKDFFKKHQELIDTVSFVAVSSVLLGAIYFFAKGHADLVFGSEARIQARLNEEANNTILKTAQEILLNSGI